MGFWACWFHQAVLNSTRMSDVGIICTRKHWMYFSYDTLFWYTNSMTFSWLSSEFGISLCLFSVFLERVMHIHNPYIPCTMMLNIKYLCNEFYFIELWLVSYNGSACINLSYVVLQLFIQLPKFSGYFDFFLKTKSTNQRQTF